MTRARMAVLFALLAGVSAGAPRLDPGRSGGGPGPHALQASYDSASRPGPTTLYAAAPVRAAEEPDTIYKIDITGAPTKGPRKAAVTIVEFSDYQ